MFQACVEEEKLSAKVLFVWILKSDGIPLDA